MDNVAVIVGAFVTVITGSYAVTKLLLKQASKDRDADRDERKELAEAIKDMAKHSKAVAEATKKSAKEAETRNGHLGEQSIQIAQLVAESIGKMTELADNNREVLLTAITGERAKKDRK